MFVKIYHAGHSLGDSLKQMIQRSLNAEGLSHYQLRPHRVNMTKEEVSELSAEVSRQIYQQWQLETVKEELQIPADTLSYSQLTEETRIAFPFVDTLYNGWITIPDSAARIDTLPVVFSNKRPFYRVAAGAAIPFHQIPPCKRHSHYDHTID